MHRAIGAYRLLLPTCLVLATCASAQEYRIEPGDVLGISVSVGMPDYNPPRQVTVGPDGVFSYPLVGEVPAAGRTRADVAATIRTALEKLYRRVDVAVNVEEYRARELFVVGEVQKPGAVVVPGPSLRLEQALAQAGGCTPAAASIMLYRPGQGPREIALAGGEVGNEGLLPGDILNVIRRQPLMVVGEVAKPGPAEVPEGGRLTDVLGLAGGLTPEADARHAVLVNHQSHTTVVDLEQLLGNPESPLNLPMADYHTLVIAPKRAVAVIGEVSRPGLYSAGHAARLAELLAAAGGLTPTAGATVTVVTEYGEAREVDLQGVLRGPGSETDPVIEGCRAVVISREESRIFVLGEVRTPGAITEGPMPVPLLGVLAQMGGPTERADLGRVLVYGADGTQSEVSVAQATGGAAAGEGQAAGPPIASNSVVVVPARQARVTVLGAVKEPGSYTFAEGDTVVDAVAMAGGFAEKAAMARVGLLRRRPEAVEVTELDLRAGLRGGSDLLAGPLQDRDVVMVPTGKRTNWASIAAVLFGLSTVYRDVTD